MARLLILCLALLLPTAAQASDADAKKLAQDILTKGAALFDTRDAAAMAATYTEDAEAILVTKDTETESYKSDVTRGRAEIERGYQDIFKDREPGTTSRNGVEYAHFVGPDLLIIHGAFTLDINDAHPIPFVQVRTKQAGKWLIMNLQLFVVQEEASP
jgi:ketosteroid isomerase-like protein